MKGQRKVRVLMRKGGQKLLEQMKKMIIDSELIDDQTTKPEERGNI